MHPHIHKYRQAHRRTLQFGGSANEQTIRNNFINLINDFAQDQNLYLIPELRDKSNNTIPDGTLKDRYQTTCGYYEAKDPNDNLDHQIQHKLKLKGYSSENILFENSKIAVLYQEHTEVLRIDIADDRGLERIIRTFLNFKRSEIEDFEKALAAFKQDVPNLTKALRKLIDQAQSKATFIQQRDHFLKQCQGQINPKIIKEDIREMIIQHFLTGQLFQSVFSEVEFHRENTIARRIDDLVRLAFDRRTRHNFENKNAHFYHTLELKAKSIRDHHDKQGFLKTLYEEFYKAYNPKAADRLGVVYTPSEVVRFIIHSANYLLNRYFDTDLSQPNINILDPATGTGTFVADLIDYLPHRTLQYKYQNEIFANEIAILPYYIAALNIEYTYQQKMQDYREFPNLAFVDTLENYSSLQNFTGEQTLQFGLTKENKAAVQRQNEAKISVIIGNPPYNANQQNYNDQNANRSYAEIDKRIKNSFMRASAVSNRANLYDMYVRFYRWAMDRLDPKKGGIVAFVTNSNFLRAISFNGFRKCVFEDFDYIYVVDLGGDIRSNYGRGRGISNVFDIQVGVCVAFFVKTPKRNQRHKLFYYALEDAQRRAEKLLFLKTALIEDLPLRIIHPDKNHNWLDLTDNDFESLLALCSPDVKNDRVDLGALFKFYSLGVNTGRDAWVYDFDKKNLENKIRYFIKIYERTRRNSKYKGKFLIKWGYELDSYRNRNIKKDFDSNQLASVLFRPFVKKQIYFDRHFITRVYQNPKIFGERGELQNKVIAFVNIGCSQPFHCLVSSCLVDLHLTGDSQYLPLYRYDSDGRQIENITEWGLEQFQNHYRSPAISKAQIFHYVYAILHCPNYRKTYEFNLKRNFPRIPFYEDFQKWAEAGRKLIDLHIDYEHVEPYSLKRHDLKVKSDALIRPKLKADPLAGQILIDDQTTLSQIPTSAWTYKLGNRSALEWVLDQYKEKPIRDKTIAEQFNTYKFADYKEDVILLLEKVCQVSVETVKIIDSMEKDQTD